MVLEKPDFSSEGNGPPCSICLENVVVDRLGRSTAKLNCGHQFHLDCIGSAFNAKGAMQCPNCRKVEKGRWLYANGHRSTPDFDFDGWVTEDIYDIAYPELPFGFQWCPVRGFTQLASLFEEAETQPSSNHEFLGNSTFGDQSNASSSSHACPLAPHGFIHSIPSSSADPVSASGSFYRHPSNLGGQSSAEILNSHNYPANEQQHHNWQQQHSIPFSFSAPTDQASTQYGLGLSRNDTSSQQRLGSFVHPHPLLHGPVAHNRSNLMGSLGPPVVGEVGSHNRAAGNHLHQQPMPSSFRSSHYPPVRRIRPRAITVVSSVATTSSIENGSFYGFSLSGTVNRNHQESDNMSRYMERYNRWGRDLTPLPWIPVEGESQWWGPFNPSHNPPTVSFSPRTPAGERSTRAENGCQRMPPRMLPPYM